MSDNGRCSCKGYTEELFVAQCLHQVSDSMYPAWYYNNDDDDDNIIIIIIIIIIIWEHLK